MEVTIVAMAMGPTGIGYYCTEWSKKGFPFFILKTCGNGTGMDSVAVNGTRQSSISAAMSITVLFNSNGRSSPVYVGGIPDRYSIHSHKSPNVIS